MSRFFIDRPIFAWVLAIVLMMAGALALRSLPIEQFPEIAPPKVTIATLYPGADAQTLENTTTQVIEQQLKGIDHLSYFSSTSDSAGNLTITLTFEQGTDADTAQVQVQNKLQQATALLPQEVQQQGLTVSKSAATFLLILALYSEDGSYDQVDLGDYVASNLQDPLSRVAGVGDTQVLGAMRSPAGRVVMALETADAGALSVEGADAEPVALFAPSCLRLLRIGGMYVTTIAL